MLNLTKQKLLVIAPHPDDEVIGCGGLIKRIKDAGRRVYVLYLTVGDTRDFTKKSSSTIGERRLEIEKVARFFGFDDYYLAFEGNDYHLRLDTLGQKAIMDIIERECPVSLESVKPTIVTFPSPASYNQDHRIVANATHAALRPTTKSNKNFVPFVLSYEEAADHWQLLSSSEPNFLLPLTQEDLAAKIFALKLYKSQLRLGANPRSPQVLKTLATVRGSLCGAAFAEGFLSWRTVVET